MHRIYRGALVQETRFWCTKWNKRCVGTGNALLCVPNGQKDAVGTGKALLVYQQGQDISAGQWKETVAEQ